MSLCGWLGVATILCACLCRPPQDKQYPRDWWLARGRLRVMLRQSDGSPVNPEVPTRELPQPFYVARGAAGGCHGAYAPKHRAGQLYGGFDHLQLAGSSAVRAQWCAEHPTCATCPASAQGAS